MYSRSKLLLILIVCVLSIFSVQQMSYAHGDHSAIKKAERNASNEARYMGIVVGSYNQLYGTMNTLINEWKANKKAIKKGNQAALSGTAVAVVSGAAAVTAAVASGGSLAPAVAPVAFSAYLALQEAMSANSVDPQKLIEAMDTVLSAMDAALTDVNTAYSMGGTLVLPKIDPNTFKVRTNSNGTVVTMEATVDGYSNDYRTYLTSGATHLGVDYMTLFDEVQKNAGEVGSHTFSVVSTYRHWPVKPEVPGHYTWKTYGLPSDYECDGPCTDKFRSPHEALTAHQVTCGDGTVQDVDDEFSQIIDKYDKYGPPLDPNDMIYSIQDILDKRSVAQGCGRSYYKCPSRLDHKAVQKHKERTCTKGYTDKTGKSGDCRDSKGNRTKFRKCMGHSRDHDESDWWNGAGQHSDKGDSDETAQNPSTSPPSMHACGSHATTVSGDHSQITPPCGDSSHANIVLYACQTGITHATQITGYNGTFYECQPHQTFACGHTDLTSNSYTHRSETCPTNSNGQACSSGSYYACQSHTHVYPTPAVTCARKACGATVSNRLEHRVNCDKCKGHYWTCIAGATYNHTTTFTCRRKNCGVTFTGCTNGTCNGKWGPFTYHWAE